MMAQEPVTMNVYDLSSIEWYINRGTFPFKHNNRYYSISEIALPPRHLIGVEPAVITMHDVTASDDDVKPTILIIEAKEDQE